MRWFTLFCLAVPAALLTGCAQAPAPPDTHDADVRTIRADGEQWQKDFAAKDADKLVSHYTDDALVVNPGSPPIKGKEGARTAFKQMVSDPAFSLTFDVTTVEVAKSGDMGYAQGPYKLTMTDPVTKKVIEDHGSYLELYKKQADGSWKSAVDIGTSEVFAAPAPAPTGKTK
jgi:uncharacterized protein (TIGR02246 family)